ncbi:hypothetical protein PDM28_17940 [Stenotrophomonas aracearum]|uniref:DUF2061 domain-containing protein n=1 Tax=Stenotrophomonas aracearum TaxID=3003272 RepID=A0ABY9YCU4_9GAMM|nr:hypothetical protein [Stenotrophomonas sp. A5588]WNH48517.1 hypothetical protein PDM28_17940 [Stenotrophomonas sp. A5588]
MKFSDVRFDELSNDQLRELPKEWIVHHMGRPTRSKIISAKRATRFRSALIAALCIYTFATQGSHLLAALELCLIGYEIAYYTLWKAKLEGDYIDHLRAYTEEANNLPEWPAIEE